MGSTDFCLESNRRLLHRSRIRESTVLACLIRPLLLLRLAFVAHALRLVQIGVAAYVYMQLLLICGAAQHLWPYAHAFGGQTLPTLSSWQACRMTGLLRVPLHRISRSSAFGFSTCTVAVCRVLTLLESCV